MAECWVKLHALDLDDPEILTLEWDEQGVYYALWPLSKAKSDVPSLFIENGRPMTLERIQQRLNRGGMRDARIIQRAITRCLDLGLLKRSPAIGYELTRWAKTQTGQPGEKALIQQEKTRLRRALRESPPRDRDRVSHVLPWRERK